MSYQSTCRNFSWRTWESFSRSGWPSLSSSLTTWWLSSCRPPWPSCAVRSWPNLHQVLMPLAFLCFWAGHYIVKLAVTFSMSFFSQVRRSPKESSGSRETGSPSTSAAKLTSCSQNKSAAWQHSQFWGRGRNQQRSGTFSYRTPGLKDPHFVFAQSSGAVPRNQPTHKAMQETPFTSNNKQTHDGGEIAERWRGGCHRAEGGGGQTRDPKWKPGDGDEPYWLASTLWAFCFGCPQPPAWRWDHWPSRSTTSTSLLPWS